MKLIADVNFDMSYSFSLFFCASGERRPPIWLISLLEEEKKKRLYIFLQERNNQQAMAWSRRMLGTTQRILGGKAMSRKNIMNWSGRTENNRVVNFSARRDDCVFVDVEITDVILNSPCGKVVYRR